MRGRPARRGSDPHRAEDDVAALAAVWGREASATAAPHERPTIGPAPGSRRPRRSAALLLGAGIALVVAIAVATTVVGADGDDETGGRRATTTTTTAPDWEPGWTVPVTCPRFEITAERRTTACPVATDDERVYVIEALDDAEVLGNDPVPTLVATGVADGRSDWAVPFPAGASIVHRYPSTVLVVGPDGTHSIDPETGEVRWTLPGVPVAPLGRDHVLLDRLIDTGGGRMDTTMSVVEAGTGAVTFSSSGPSLEVYVHPCDAAGLVLVSDGDRLVAHEVADGAERWAVDARHHDASDPIVCSAQMSVAAEPDALLSARDLRTGVEVDGFIATIDGDAGLPNILDVVGTTVVVSSERGLAGYATEPDLGPIWQLDLGSGGREAVVGAAGDGVLVAVPGDRAASFGAHGESGGEVSLAGRDDVVVEAGRLLAWGPQDVLVATGIDLDRARTIALADVRRAAATPTHVVVTTRDEVRLYPFDP